MRREDHEPQEAPGRYRNSRRAILVVCMAALIVAMVGFVTFSITQMSGMAGQGGAPGASPTATEPPAAAR